MKLHVVLPDPDADRDLAAAAAAAGASRTTARGAGLSVERLGGDLTLRVDGDGSPMRVRVDVRTLRPGSTRRTSLLARAVGGRRGDLVVDATAGLGQDAAELAHLGLRVIACERHPILALMLREATGSEEAPFQVHEGDATELLPILAARERPHAVYLDPMFAMDGLRARAGKAAQVLQHLCGTGSAEQDRALLAAAWPWTDRVVVKRPLRAPTIADGVSFHLAGKAIRFDVYLTLGRSAPGA